MRLQLSTLLQSYMPTTSNIPSITSGFTPPSRRISSPLTLTSPTNHGKVSNTTLYEDSPEETSRASEFFLHPSTPLALVEQSAPTDHTSPAQSIQTHRAFWCINDLYPSASSSPPYSVTNITGIAAVDHNSDDMNYPVEPPRHERPLYSCIPLPDELFILHPTLQYSLHPDWNTPSPSLGSCCHYWSKPATTPSLEALEIIFPWPNMRPVYVKPSSLIAPTRPYEKAVTVRDVLAAIDGVMDSIGIGYSIHSPQQQPPMLNSRGQSVGRCPCAGKVPSLEYLRHVYGRAGLVNINRESNVWVFKIG